MHKLPPQNVLSYNCRRVFYPRICASFFYDLQNSKSLIHSTDTVYPFLCNLYSENQSMINGRRSSPRASDLTSCGKGLRAAWLSKGVISFEEKDIESLVGGCSGPKA